MISCVQGAYKKLTLVKAMKHAGSKTKSNLIAQQIEREQNWGNVDTLCSFVRRIISKRPIASKQFGSTRFVCSSMTLNDPAIDTTPRHYYQLHVHYYKSSLYAIYSNISNYTLQSDKTRRADHTCEYLTKNCILSKKAGAEKIPAIFQ